jgi:alpha-tubulin suppressor-like RCC1 family protein
MKFRAFVVLLLALSTGGASAADAATPIATGAYHGCSASSGLLLCWGDNSAGELGDGTRRSSASPVKVASLRSAALEVAASYDRTCALVSGPRVYCWGRAAKLDSSGRPVASKTPARVSGIPVAAHGLVVGVNHACVLDAADATWCWGVNDRGQLGDGTTKARPRPVKAQASAASEALASDGYTCVVLRGGGVSCWGRSHGGDGGDPLNPEGLVVDSKVPMSIAGLETATHVSATGDFACAILAGGAVSCWGENDHGQLGDGSVTGRATPAVVTGLPEVIQVVESANHACALDVDGSVFCWGRGDHGQMGDGTYGDRHVPGPVVQPRPALKLFAGASGHWTLAVATDGSAYAWGRNENSQLGDGGTTDQAVPIDVSV